MAEEDMDAILDQALDDLEQIDLTDERDGVQTDDVSQKLPSREATSIHDLPDDPREFFKSLIETDDDDENKRDEKLNKFVKQIGSKTSEDANTNFGSTAPQGNKVDSADDATGGAKKMDDNDHDEIAATLASIFEQMKNIDSDELENDLKSGNLNPDAIVDGMMEQLLSKELMYEPMKQVADKFPNWLDEKKSDLSDSDFQRYEKQYECFKELVDQYETDPGDTKVLLKLMEDAQEFGQPPAEIVQAIAPGLDLDSDGIPQLNPLQSLGGDGECILM